MDGCSVLKHRGTQILDRFFEVRIRLIDGLGRSRGREEVVEHS